MTPETRRFVKDVLVMVATITVTAAFAILALVVIPSNQEREQNEAQRHRELVDAVEQMMFVCEGTTKP